MIQQSFYREESRYLLYTSDAAAHNGNILHFQGLSWVPTTSERIWCLSDYHGRDKISQSKLDRLGRMLAPIMADQSSPTLAHGNDDMKTVSDILLASKLQRHDCLGFSNANFSIASEIATDEDLFLDMVLLVFTAPVLYILPIIYGGIHLTAWNFEFPTNIERLLWKISCLIIGSTLLSFVFLFFFVYITLSIITFSKFLKPKNLSEFLVLFRDLLRLFQRVMRFSVGILGIMSNLTTVLQGVSFIVIMVYACSRIFIVAESFISLRQVPIGVYWTPSWLQMIPHF